MSQKRGDSVYDLRGADFILAVNRLRAGGSPALQRWRIRSAFANPRTNAGSYQRASRRNPSDGSKVFNTGYFCTLHVCKVSGW